MNISKSRTCSPGCIGQLKIIVIHLEVFQCGIIFKGTLSRVDVRRSVHPRGLKKFSLQDKYVYGFSTSLSYIPLCHHTFFSVPSCSFSHRVRSPLVNAILKVQVFNLETSGWLFQVLDQTHAHVNPWQCPFKVIHQCYIAHLYCAEFYGWSARAHKQNGGFFPHIYSLLHNFGALIIFFMLKN